MQRLVNVKVNGVELEVLGDYTKGSAAVFYLRNGDPGYPAEPSEFVVESIKIGGVECSDFLADLSYITYKGFNADAEDLFDKIADACIEVIEGGGND